MADLSDHDERASWMHVHIGVGPCRLGWHPARTDRHIRNSPFRKVICYRFGCVLVESCGKWLNPRSHSCREPRYLNFCCWFTSFAGDVPTYCLTLSLSSLPIYLYTSYFLLAEVICRLVCWLHPTLASTNSHSWLLPLLTRLLPVVCSCNEVLWAPGNPTWPINQLLLCYCVSSRWYTSKSKV